MATFRRPSRGGRRESITPARYHLLPPRGLERDVVVDVVLRVHVEVAVEVLLFPTGLEADEIRDVQLPVGVAVGGAESGDGGNVRLETPDELTDTLLVESMVLNLADTSLFASLAQSDVKEIAIDTILVTANQDTIPNLVFANITTDTTLLVVSVSGNTLDYSYLQAQSGPSNLLSILYRKNKRNNSDLAYLPTLYKRDIRIYPNPSNGLFKIATVKNTTTAMQIEINDLIGNTMQRHIWDGSLYKEIDLSNYASGIYFVAVKGEGFSYNYKLIKE